MTSKTEEKSSCSIGQWCQQCCSNIGQSLHSLRQFNYNRKDGLICGRDGKCWSKLAAFYFFFYIALAGFFCLYLSIFMLFLPLNQPRYIGEDSRLTSRSNPLSPGLSFRPQASPHLKELLTRIDLSIKDGRRKKRSNQNDDIESYVRSLDEFLETYSSSPKFTITATNDCNSNKEYGFRDGKPCILIKINKLIGFAPQMGRTDEDNKHDPVCPNVPNIPVHCAGEKLSDQNALGSIMYYSESGGSDVCGSIDVKYFPYNGKVDHNDVYQPPYVWVQFTNLTANTLITVECRIYGSNIFYDRISQRASTRFQFYLNKN